MGRYLWQHAAVCPNCRRVYPYVEFVCLSCGADLDYRTVRYDRIPATWYNPFTWVRFRVARDALGIAISPDPPQGG